MDEQLLTRLIRRFFRDPHRMSRNRNFHAFLDPKVRYAARAGRILRSLRADLLERDLESLSIVHAPTPRADDRFAIELEWGVSSRRCFLSGLELSVLREDERVRRLLDRALVDGPVLGRFRSAG